MSHHLGNKNQLSNSWSLPTSLPASQTRSLLTASRPSTTSCTPSHCPEPQPGYSDQVVVEGQYAATHPSSVPPAPRSLDMHNILNPATDGSDGNTSSTAPRSVPKAGSSPRIRKRGAVPPASTSVEPRSLSPRRGRRILTPRSPGLRASSIGARRNPTFHSSDLKSLSSSEYRAYTIEPGQGRNSDVPPIPPLPLSARPPLSTQSTEEIDEAARSLPGPGSLTLSMSYTSHFLTEGSGLSPITGNRMPPQQSVHSVPAAYPMSTPTVSPAFASRQPPVTSHEELVTIGSGYQMTLDTDQGPLVVPVKLDLQQASKMADEKRKRNAGASARFRARRKEKEKEASQTISGLKQEIRDISDQRDFYVGERNYYRDLASRHLGLSVTLVRPPSPQTQRRLSSSVSSADMPPSKVEETYREINEEYGQSHRSRVEEYRSYQSHYSPSTSQTRTTSHPAPPAPSTARPSAIAPTSPYGLPFPSQPPLPNLSRSISNYNPSLPPLSAGLPAASPVIHSPSITLPPAAGSGSSGPTGPGGLARSHSFDPFRQNLFR